MIARLDGLEGTLQAITKLAMRAAIDKVRQSRQVLYPEVSSNTVQAELHVPSEPFAQSWPFSAAKSRGAEVVAASGWDSDPVDDPFKLDAEDNLLGDEGEDPFGSWSSTPKKKTQPKAGDEKEPESDYVDFSLEGILDEALKVEDHDVETAPSIGGSGENEGLAEENAFAGVLEDVLGTGPRSKADEFEEEFGLDIEQPLSAPPRQDSDTSPGKADVDPVGERFDAISANRDPVRTPPIDDLARTKLSSNVDNLLYGSKEKESTSPDLRNSSAHVDVGPRRQDGKPKHVVVPVHLSIAPDTEEVEIEVTLEIKIKREEGSF